MRHVNPPCIYRIPVYNGPSVVIRRLVCALVATFPYTLKQISSSLFSKGEINFTNMQTKHHEKTQKNVIENVQALCATISATSSAQSS